MMGGADLLVLFLFLFQFFSTASLDWTCPAGFECATESVWGERLCPVGSFSLQNWGRCCTFQEANLCRGQTLNMNCTCAPLNCKRGSEAQRGPPGKVLCLEVPSQCEKSPACGMLRERHTCNCFHVNSQTVLWGNEGGPYFEISEA